MKKLIILYVILLIIIISTCTTIREKEYITYQYILPSFPIRETIVISDNPTINDYAKIINYYEHLVQKWEIWGNSVKKILDKKND